MVAKQAKRPGPKSFFHGKVRKPVTITLTPAHHGMVRRRMLELGVTRAELIALLIEKYAQFVTTGDPAPDAYKRLRSAVEVLGGTLKHKKQGEPRGGTWVLTLKPKCHRMPSEQAMRYKDLDECYVLEDGIVFSGTWEDQEDVINPIGLAKLFALLADSKDVGTD